MDKLFWSVRKIIFKKDTTIAGATAFKMDTEQIQDNIFERCNQQTVQYKEAKPAIILSLGKGVLF